MGAGSILRLRHMLDASALTKTASGKRSKRSSSKASSFLTGTLSDADSAAMCRPVASRACLSTVPTLTTALNGSAAITSNPAVFEGSCSVTSGSRSSLTERTFVIQTGFTRLTIALLQLVSKLLHGFAVIESLLNLDPQPKRFCVGKLAVV